MKELFWRVWGDENGQGMTEYMLLVVVMAISLGVAFKQFHQAVLAYYNRVTLWVSLPIP